MKAPIMRSAGGVNWTRCAACKAIQSLANQGDGDSVACECGEKLELSNMTMVEWDALESQFEFPVSPAIRSIPASAPSAPRTIAQSIRISSDPYRAAITSFSRREVIRSDDGQSDKKIFHFEDDSFLAFMVSYAAIEDGVA